MRPSPGVESLVVSAEAFDGVVVPLRHLPNPHQRGDDDKCDDDKRENAEPSNIGQLLVSTFAPQRAGGSAVSSAFEGATGVRRATCLSLAAPNRRFPASSVPGPRRDARPTGNRVSDIARFGLSTPANFLLLHANSPCLGKTELIAPALISSPG